SAKHFLRPFPYADHLRTVDTRSMAELPHGDRAVTRPTALRSLSSKFSVFAAALVFSVVVTIVAYDLRQDSFDWGKGLLLCAIVFLVAAAIARFTICLLPRPPRPRQEGMTPVQSGRPEPIRVSI